MLLDNSGDLILGAGDSDELAGGGGWLTCFEMDVSAMKLKKPKRTVVPPVDMK